MDWTIPVSAQQAAKRAGGRRRFNMHRKLMAAWRRLLLIDVVKELDYCKGWQSKAAERLGVNRSTVCRDLKILRKYYFYVKAATESGHLKTVKTSKKEDKFLDWSIEDCKKTAWEQIEERKHDFKEKNL